MYLIATLLFTSILFLQCLFKNVTRGHGSIGLNNKFFFGGYTKKSVLVYKDNSKFYDRPFRGR